MIITVEGFCYIENHKNGDDYMTNEQLNTALYKKVSAEQDAYREWLLSQPPDEILHHTHEYSVREDIVLALEYHDLTDNHARALLKSPSPLADIYSEWDKQEFGYMDDIRSTIESRANDIINRGRQKSQKER